MQSSSILGKESNNEEVTVMSILENEYYWLMQINTFILIKTSVVIIPKEINYIECELKFLENKIRIIENEEIQKKISYAEKTKILPFNISHLDINTEDLALIPNNNYAAILNNLKFRFLKGNSFI